VIQQDLVSVSGPRCISGVHPPHNPAYTEVRWESAWPTAWKFACLVGHLTCASEAQSHAETSTRCMWNGGCKIGMDFWTGCKIGQWKQQDLSPKGLNACEWQECMQAPVELVLVSRLNHVHSLTRHKLHGKGQAGTALEGTWDGLQGAAFSGDMEQRRTLTSSLLGNWARERPGWPSEGEA